MYPTTVVGFVARDGASPTIDVICGSALLRDHGARIRRRGCHATGSSPAFWKRTTLAERGLDITGIDVSDGMLTLARRKAAACPAFVRDHLALINQDMSQLNLGRRFGLAFVPFRSFQHLLTIDQQQQSLQAIPRHLEPTGRLALHLFDPRLDLLIDAKIILPGPSGSDPETGRLS